MNFIEPWNNRSILPPPVNTFRVGYNADIQNLLRLCNNIIQILSKQSPLHKESALLSRFIYKFDKKFRTDIGYRHFKKLNTALKKYLLLKLMKDIKDFTAALPVEDANYLPTRQKLEYVLVRIITFSKLMMRIYVCSKQASIYYMDRVKRGESHWMSLMPYALVSRIWSISTILLQHSCSWYSGLYPYLSKLSPKGIDFLPINYTLPLDLGKWIDIENIDEYGRFEWTHKQDIPISMLMPEDDLTFDTIIDYVNDINMIESKEDDNITIQPQNNDVSYIGDKESIQVFPREYPSTISIKSSETEDKAKVVDHGEKITREYFKTFFSNPKDKKIINHCPDNVTSTNTLDSFVTMEENYRNENSDSSLTKHLGFMQWQSLKTSLLNLKELLGGNRKIERKFKKIWKQKCLDYQ